MLSFDEARALLEKRLGQPANAYGRGDADNYYIGRYVPDDEPVQDGEICVFAVNKADGTVTGVPTDPLSMRPVFLADERYGDLPED